eukprot:365811-Chlamydomonas_euryale.AAC.8
MLTCDWYFPCFLRSVTQRYDRDRPAAGVALGPAASAWTRSLLATPPAAFKAMPDVSNEPSSF